MIETIFCYVLCYFGTEIPHIAMKFATIAYDSMWYMYPIKEQELMKIVIQRSQQPIKFNGYGIINCNLAMFLSVSYCI